MFVGRKEELSILEAAYESESFQMMVVYGRRRVGKTSLIRKFAENKSNVQNHVVLIIRTATLLITHQHPLLRSTLLKTLLHTYSGNPKTNKTSS